MRRTVLRLLILGFSLCVSSFAQLTSPQIVATVSLVNQTTDIPATPLFTPQTDGLFRVSAYLLLTKPDIKSFESWCLTTGWTDDLGLEYSGNVWGAVCVNPDHLKTFEKFADFVHVIRANAGTPVSYLVTGPSGGGSVFELYITVEQLQ